MNLNLKSKNILWIITSKQYGSNNLSSINEQLIDKNLIIGENCNSYIFHLDSIDNVNELKKSVENYVKDFNITTIFYHRCVSHIDSNDNKNEIIFRGVHIPYEYFSDSMFKNIEVVSVVDDTYTGFYKYMDMDYIDLWVSIDVFTSTPYNDKHLCLFTPIPKLEYKEKRETFCYFSGFLSADRIRYLSVLLSNNINVDINPNRGDISREKYLQELSNSKICINSPGYVMNWVNRDKQKLHHVRSYTPGRVMETLGCGTLLFNFNDEGNLINNYLQEDENYISFNSGEELIKKMVFYKNNEKLREAIAKNGYLYSEQFRIDNFYKTIFERLGYYG